MTGSGRSGDSGVSGPRGSVWGTSGAPGFGWSGGLGSGTPGGPGSGTGAGSGPGTGEGSPGLAGRSGNGGLGTSSAAAPARDPCARIVVSLPTGSTAKPGHGHGFPPSRLARKSRS